METESNSLPEEEKEDTDDSRKALESDVFADVEQSGLLLENSIVKSLFLGQILEQNLFPFPTFAEEEAETLRIVLESIDRFLQEKRKSFELLTRKGLRAISSLLVSKSWGSLA